MLFMMVSVLLRRDPKLAFEHLDKISRVHISNLHADFIYFFGGHFQLVTGTIHAQARDIITYAFTSFNLINLGQMGRMQIDMVVPVHGGKHPDAGFYP